VSDRKLKTVAVLERHMEWGLFVLAMLFVAALQFAVWRRIQSGDVDVSDSAAPREQSHPADLTSEPENPDLTLCPACGAENDPGYDFCRRCVGSLRP
jgi:ribosomal protein L40E